MTAVWAPPRILEHAETFIAYPATCVVCGDFVLAAVRMPNDELVFLERWVYGHWDASPICVGAALSIGRPLVN
jgi:hypothetical protein